MKQANFQNVFKLALEGEGKLLKAYSVFHTYSYLNQMWAYYQMLARGLEISPIASFKKWQSLGRNVKKDEKGLEICVPKTVKDKETGENICIGFLWLNKAFAMSQTEGDEFDFPVIDFDFDKCLEVLKIKKVPFTHTDGNCQGFAQKGQIAINPIAEKPDKTFFHEVAHVLLHLQGDEEFVDNATTVKSLKEVEAESVALCVSLALGLDDNIEYCRGYIKAWLKTEEIPDASIKNIFSATNKILKAGAKAE